MNLCSDLVEVDSNVSKAKTVKTSASVFVEALFFIWVGLFASLTFIGTLILAVMGILGFRYVLYIYAGISILTLVLALLLYFLRGKQKPSDAA
jgi:hypothetical protein